MTHLQDTMIEATHYRMLLDVFRRDSAISPQSAAQMRGIFEASTRQARRGRTSLKIHAAY
jgi:hypothetical protein